MTQDWDPFNVLGIAPTASKEEAKVAFRRLAQKYHPDKGGDETKFKEVKKAWEFIEGGYKRVEPHKSSFSDPKPAQSSQPKQPSSKQPKPRPAPGYESKGPLKMQRTNPPQETFGRLKHDGEITFEITPKQAFEGCIIPFIHQRSKFNYEVRPGTLQSRSSIESFLSEEDEVIGVFRKTGYTTIKVNLVIKDKVEDPKVEPKPESPKQTGDFEVVHAVCALGLFSGGKIETKDAYGDPVSISLQPGFNPRNPIIVEGRGYGNEGHRGKLIIKIEPVFKAPSEFSENERKMFRRVGELLK